MTMHTLLFQDATWTSTAIPRRVDLLLRDKRDIDGQGDGADEHRAVVPYIGFAVHAVIHPYGFTADESRIDLGSIKVSSMRDTSLVHTSTSTNCFCHRRWCKNPPPPRGGNNPTGGLIQVVARKTGNRNSTKLIRYYPALPPSDNYFATKHSVCSDWNSTRIWTEMCTYTEKYQVVHATSSHTSWLTATRARARALRRHTRHRIARSTRERTAGAAVGGCGGAARRHAMEGCQSSTVLLAHRAVCVCLVHVLLMPVPAAFATRSTSTSAANLIVDHLRDGPPTATRSLSNAQAGQLPTRVAVAASSSEVERFAAGVLVDKLNSAKTNVAWPVLQSKRDVFDAWAASFNASVNAIHGPWLPQKGKYEWMQWGENRCDKACFEMEIFQNNTYPVCSAHSRRAAVKTDDFQFDVLVYGSTSGGVTAAVAASRHGLKVGMLVANGGGCGPTEAGANHIGGMTTSGLGKTDIGAASQGGIIGGVALEFYTANAKHYNTTAPPSWDHEPHVAQASMASLLSNSTVTVIRGLTTHGSNVAHVTKSGTRIVSLQTADGRVFSATAFIDGSYEGDLLAAAGGSWVVGREAQETYNESAAGRRADDFNRGYQFRVRVSPFDVSGKVLPLLIAEDEPVGVPGRADSRVQAYNFRLCATSDPNGQAPFPYPDPASPFRSNDTWELARRYFADPLWKSAERPGVLTFIGESPPLDHKKHKRDWNNPFLSPLNTDCIVGCNQSRYPHATVEERLKIWEAHRNYYLSLVHFMRSDAGVPADVKSTMRNWGLCADEFNNTGHWPPQLYVRETRRMLGDHVFTQNSPQTISPTIGNSSVGVGDYAFDSHPAQRLACRNGTDPRCAGAKPPWLKAGEIETQPFAWSEGNVQQGTEPYAIPYWVMTPKRVELSNLLVTATPSGSHIGFSSLRMEPQFMVLGHSAGTAAAVFVNNHTGGDTRAIQDVDPDVLTAALLREGQVLHPSTRPHSPHGWFGWGCDAMGGAGPRCIAIAQSKPNPGGNNCSGECRALAPNEWLANTGFWRKIQSGPPQLVSTQKTYLKKGVAQSNVLPPELVKEVPVGFKCTLVSDSRKLLDGYDLCVV
eukprot:COSAG02_NODE_2659_length_8310_cov_10.600901_2_plen_1084_part_00